MVRTLRKSNPPLPICNILEEIIGRLDEQDAEFRVGQDSINPVAPSASFSHVNGTPVAELYNAGPLFPRGGPFLPSETLPKMDEGAYVLMLPLHPDAQELIGQEVALLQEELSHCVNGRIYSKAALLRYPWCDIQELQLSEYPKGKTY